MRPFVEFLKTDEGRSSVDAEFIVRFERASAKVVTLTGLLNFARERWPASYPKNWRGTTGDEPYGRETMGLLWAKYLQWVDEMAD